jgi:hypothetical protein
MPSASLSAPPVRHGPHLALRIAACGIALSACLADAELRFGTQQAEARGPTIAGFIDAGACDEACPAAGGSGGVEDEDAGAPDGSASADAEVEVDASPLALDATADADDLDADDLDAGDAPGI